MPRERIGEGGFGAVYRCEQPLLGREAVIKVLHSRLRASEVMADSGSKRVLEPKHNRHFAKSGRNTRSKMRSPPRNTTLFQSENSMSRRYASIP